MSVKQGGNTIAGASTTDTANKNLSNLNSQGQNIANWSTNVANCITEIPQDIKLELNNGTLTLKAGSKVYVPNGAGVFDEVVIDANKTRTWTYTKQGMMFYRYDTNVLMPVPLSNIYSGTTAPTGTLPIPTCWYDTTNNKIKVTSDGGATWIDTHSLPLCLLTANGTQITSIDQVFNGFGYIGSTVFALPGVKGLIPNGRNEDGTLKNIEFTLDSVKTVNVVANQTNYSFVLNSDGIYSLSTYQEVNVPVSGYVNYVASENKIYNGVNQRFWAYVASYSSGANGVITSLTPKTPFHAVDYNDLQNYVTTDTAQTISGEKTLLAKLTLGNNTEHLGNIELFGGNSTFGGYIDFHYGNSTSDYTSRIIENSSGNINLDCTSVTAPATTKTNGVVTTTGLSKARSGYVKLGNGIIIQWGYSSSFGTDTTVTFPTSFSSATSFTVIATPISSTAYGYPTYIKAQTATNFTGRRNDGNKPATQWLAIGY